MLKSKEKDDCLYSLVNQYIAQQQQNRVYQRENSDAYTYAKGVLVGFCTAFQYEIKENDKNVDIVTKSGRLMLRMVK